MQACGGDNLRGMLFDFLPPIAQAVGADPFGVLINRVWSSVSANARYLFLISVVIAGTMVCFGGTNTFVLATTVFFIGQTIALIVGYSDPQFLLFVFDASHRKVNYDPGKV